MSAPRTDIVVDAETQRRQRLAADPRLSVWVSANAGSGKTKVLADRVIRLLLDEVPPGRILCLTFTKAAAANMSLRIFGILGRWVRLTDAELSREIDALEGARPDAARLARARRLFASAVETPGGLKIETIHAFCERVLHIAPFEANVPAHFEVLDDLALRLLERQAHEEVFSAALREPQTQLAAAWRALAPASSRDRLSQLIREAAAAREFIAIWGRGDAEREALRATLCPALGLLPDETLAGIHALARRDAILPQSDPDIFAALEASTKAGDNNLAAALRAAAALPPDLAFEPYWRCFSTDKGEPRADSGFPTKEAGPAAAARIRAERDRMTPLAGKAKSLAILDRSAHLWTLAAAIAATTTRLKRQRGGLDFTDLIARTAALFARAEAAWVLYKLDAGLDHILIDEAQDTSPDQWRIIRALTDEFFAGAGSPVRRPRTVFAVGDPKQSIYGFQGAEPRLFEETGRDLERAVRAVEGRFESLDLFLSFRSAPGVLSAVDQVFSVKEHFSGLSFRADLGRTVHESARPNAPGEVELWPVLTREKSGEDDPWTLPLDEPDSASPAVATARAVADAIAAWTTTGDRQGRVWSPGDILVLVRKRGPAFEALIRELKRRQVAVAGADRLDLSAQIAVLDIAAIGRAALCPTDDLTLATALKTPLAGFTDDDLVEMIGGRPKEQSAHDAILERAGQGHPRACRARDLLRLWQDKAQGSTPFTFFAWLLGPMEGRAALIARLGSEAGDAVDAILQRALDSERNGIPSLVAFLSGLEADEPSLRRDLDAAAREVRVMTVHGAKGLEAPLVVLIDDGSAATAGPREALTCLRDVLGPRLPDIEVPLWVGSAKEAPRALAAFRDTLADAALQEHNRLLYVALTRAADRLIVAPFLADSRKTKPPEDSWGAMVRRALDCSDARVTRMPVSFASEPALVWSQGAATAAASAPPQAVQAASDILPAWLHAPVPDEPSPAPPISPSRAHMAADLPARRNDGPVALGRRLRGVLTHAMFERLPDIAPARRRQVARAYLATRAGSLPEADRDAIVADTLAVMDHPDLVDLFSPQARAEVPVAGRIAWGPQGELRPVGGQVDRIVVGNGIVRFADFKTTGYVPAPGHPLPRAHLVQAAIYAALLREACPGHEIRACIVYTAGPSVENLLPSTLDAVLREASAQGG
jgi:ATP-dependent helicase/nuclease subunit A